MSTCQDVVFQKENNYIAKKLKHDRESKSAI